MKINVSEEFGMIELESESQAEKCQLDKVGEEAREAGMDVRQYRDPDGLAIRVPAKAV